MKCFAHRKAAMRRQKARTEGRTGRARVVILTFDSN